MGLRHCTRRVAFWRDSAYKYLLYEMVSPQSKQFDITDSIVAHEKQKIAMRVEFSVAQWRLGRSGSQPKMGPTPRIGPDHEVKCRLERL